MNQQADTICRACRHSTGVSVDRGKTHGGLNIECPRCGRYEITMACIDACRPASLTAIQRAAVCCWLRQKQTDGRTPTLDSEIMRQLVTHLPFPTLHDQRENLLSHLGMHSNGAGDRVDVDSYMVQFSIGASTPNTIEVIIDHLRSEGLVLADPIQNQHQSKSFAVRLTFKGWLAYEDIRRGKTSGRRAFMAMPFNKPDLEPVWLDKLRVAVDETGFKLERVDDNPKPGLIDDQMSLQIKQARFLIVELTHANNGAYWEAGFAEGLGKPVIYTFRKDMPKKESPHFDVEHSLRAEWTPDTMEAAIKKLKAVIRNAMPDALPEPETEGS